MRRPPTPTPPTSPPPGPPLDLTKLLAARYRAARARPYLAVALYAMTVVSSPSARTMGVDRYWRCYVSPAFVAATDVTDLAGVWLHEVSHLLREHHARAGRLLERSRADADSGRTPVLDPTRPEREQLRMNLAMDCEINDDLCTGLGPDSGVRLPAGAVTAASLGIPAEVLFEQYLHRISGGFTAGRFAWVDCGSGSHGGSVPWELDGRGARPLSPAQASAVRYRVAHQVRLTGDAPLGWKRWAEDLTEPGQDWRRLLRTTLRNSITQVGGTVDYSYRRPGRRSAALGRTVVMPTLQKPLPHVAIVIDTSGSVTDSELGVALGETAGILTAVGTRGRISVYSCDAAVHTAQEVCRATQITLAGGGGTDLRLGMLRAQAARPRPDIIVVITDGHTPWPERRPSALVIAGLLGPRPSTDEVDSWAPPRPPDWAVTVQLGP